MRTIVTHPGPTTDGRGRVRGIVTDPRPTTGRGGGFARVFGLNGIGTCSSTSRLLKSCNISSFMSSTHPRFMEMLCKTQHATKNAATFWGLCSKVPPDLSKHLKRIFSMPNVLSITRCCWHNKRCHPGVLIYLCVLPLLVKQVNLNRHYY